MNTIPTQTSSNAATFHALDHSFRRLFRRPCNIIKPYVTDGMSILDIGCGPGFFSIEMASALNKSGKIIAADVQQEMLDKIKEKIHDTPLEDKIQLHLCNEDSIGLNEKVDLILAFYRIHETSNQKQLFTELKSLLNTNGKILIVEPKVYISEKKFEEMREVIEEVGLKIIDNPKILFSRTMLLAN